MCVYQVFQRICDKLVSSQCGISENDIQNQKNQLLLFLNDKYCSELLLKKDSFFHEKGFDTSNPYHLDRVFDFLYEQALWFFRDKITTIREHTSRSSSPSLEIREVVHTRTLDSKPAISSFEIVYEDEKTSKEIMELVEKNKQFKPIVDGLIQECEAYRKLLFQRLCKIDIPEDYQLNDENKNSMQKNKLPKTITFTPILNSKNRKHVVEDLQRIKGEVNRYNKVQELYNTLTDDNNLPEEKVKNFVREFEKPITQQILTKNYDSAGWRFIKNIGHILTFGIVSKFTKGTFRFWKTEEELMVERCKKHYGNVMETKNEKKQNIALPPSTVAVRY